jgi:hypothetical protein
VAAVDSRVERIEQIRAGDGFMLQVSVRYGLMGGTAAPAWEEPHRPVRVPFPSQPTQVIIKAHDWVQDVLEPFQQSTAVSLVIALPQSGATDDHRAIVGRLTDARRELDKGQWKPSIAASREAVCYLRRSEPSSLSNSDETGHLTSIRAAVTRAARHALSARCGVRTPRLQRGPRLTAAASERGEQDPHVGSSGALCC